MNFWDIFAKFISKFASNLQEQFPQSLISFLQDIFPKIIWKLNYSTLMLIEQMLLNDIWTLNQKLF